MKDQDETAVAILNITEMNDYNTSITFRNNEAEFKSYYLSFVGTNITFKWLGYLLHFHARGYYGISFFF